MKKPNKNSMIMRAVIKAGGQSALGRAINVSDRTVRRWVAGETQPDGLFLRVLASYASATN